MPDYGIRLQGIAYYVPERRITNEDLISQNKLRIKASWIEQNIGIHERRWAAADEAASDLAVKAISKMGLENFNGSLWVSTLSSDYLTPSTASLIKRKMNWKSNTRLALDLNAACAGSLFAIATAKAHLENSEESEALVVATEVRSRYLNLQDRRTVFLFGDGAVAFHLKKNLEESPYRINWCEMRSEASDQDEILVPAGGSKLPVTAEVLAERLQYIRMIDGEKIFQSTTERLTEVIADLLRSKMEKIADYDFVFFHQGNGAIIHKICNNLNFSPEKTWINFDRFGNTSSASVGIAMAEAVEKGRIGNAKRILLVAMGAGYHLGLISLCWGEK